MSLRKKENKKRKVIKVNIKKNSKIEVVSKK
jgi:hypothetical protein